VNACQDFSSAPSTIAAAIQKLDCAAADATAVSYARLFGSHGSLQTALTIVLTIYVALFALSLLTGRSALRLSVLTPRMMTVGLVLTFVTSWVAYQSVVWNLAVGAPDEVATILTGGDGSATIAFAQRMDGLLEVIGNVVQTASPTESISAPTNILSIAALILLLGTLGVLAVCRLSLAALLILGPIFIALALFNGTRGLFEGWLKSVALFALVPLLTVLLGSGALFAISPTIAALNAEGGEVSLRAALSVLVASVVYVALMVSTFKVAGSLTRGWRSSRQDRRLFASPSREAAWETAASVRVNSPPASTVVSATFDRVRSTVSSLNNYAQPSAAARLSAGSASSTLSGYSPHQIPSSSSPSSFSHRVDMRTKADAASFVSRELFR
jgi:type IV secretion system protein VirB6